jgi:hypothetical protein
MRQIHSPKTEIRIGITTAPEERQTRPETNMRSMCPIKTTRIDHVRNHSELYPSDLSDDEWKLVEPLIPPGKRGGDKRTVIMREVVNGLMYILSTGCQWRAIPKDLPPRSGS